MKIGYYKDTDHLNLLLDSPEDVDKYHEVFSQIEAEKVSSMLINFNMSGRSTLTDYINHEDKHASSVQKILAFEIENNPKGRTSLIEACQKSDSIINNKCVKLLNYINNGYIIRINPLGGYCHINNYNDYPNLLEINETNEKVLSNFLINNTIKDDFLDIKKKIIIIENDKECTLFKEKICKNYNLKESEIQVLNLFKTRTILYKENDYLELFSKGLKNGLQTIFIQTTGQDKQQFRLLNILIEKIKSFNIHLNIIIYYLYI